MFYLVEYSEGLYALYECGIKRLYRIGNLYRGEWCRFRYISDIDGEDSIIEKSMSSYNTLEDAMKDIILLMLKYG